MEKLFEKNYEQVLQEDDKHMNVTIYRKDSVMSQGYEIDTLIAEVYENGFVFVVTADVTGVEDIDKSIAIQQLWELVCKDQTSSMNADWLQPFTDKLTDGSQYQTNTVGFRVLCY